MYKKMIPNSRFPYMEKSGTGNKSCRVQKSEQVRLCNIVIDRMKVTEFLNYLYAKGHRKIKVELSSRRTSSRWGTAWSLQRRVVLYRHTIWVFLHELAHILNVKEDFATGREICSAKPHGMDFGKHLAFLYDAWMKNFDNGEVTTPTAADKPDLKNDYFDQFIPKQYRENQWKVPQRRGRTVGGIKLQVGDKVTFRTKKHGLLHGIVSKVNPVNCKVKVGMSVWRVNPKLLNKV